MLLGALALLAMPLSFPLDFRSSQLPEGWKIAASEGNEVKFENNALTIRARRNTYASLQMPFGEDHVSTQARIKPAPADSWATSLFLYWGPGDWCQIGLKPMDGGRAYVTEMAEGFYTEWNLGKRPFEGWTYVRIELGDGVVRYQTSLDGKAWRTEAAHERNFSFKGAPKLLILGKGFGGPAPYTKPLLMNDYADKGEFGTSQIAAVCQEPLATQRLKPSAAEKKAWSESLTDKLGRDLLKLPGGPTYEACCKVLPGIKSPREVVGVPEHPHDIGVLADGTIQLNDNWADSKGVVAWLEVGDPPVRVGSTDCPVRNHLDGGSLPRVILSFSHEGVHFNAQVFGLSKGMRPDEPLQAFVWLDVLNTQAGSKPYRLAMRTAGPASEPEIVLWAGVVKMNEIQVHTARAVRSATWSAFEDVPGAEFPGGPDEYADHWSQLLLQGERFYTSAEPRINRAYPTWLAYNFLNVDKKNGVYEIHDGSGFYEEIYAYSANLFINALDLYGYHDKAELYLDSLLTFQQPDGLLTINYGLPDMGSLLLVMSDHYRMTGDGKWLKRVAPKMFKAIDWLIKKRAESMRAQTKGSLVYGLIKFRPYCDHPDPTYSYLSDAYAVVGMEAAAKVLPKIGIDTSKIAAEAARYRKDILASMDKAVFTAYGLPIFDIEPDTRRLLKRSRYRGGEYYGLVAPMLLETGFLPHDDKRARMITDFMEKRGGLLAGMSEFQGGVDHAYTYGYWLNCLDRGEPDRAVLGLYASMAGCISRETHSGAEVVYVKTGEPTPTLPHTYSGTQQLRTLRMLLVRETGDTLHLGRGIPRGWMEDGKETSVKQAPTLFGPVSLSYKSELKKGRIVATLDPPKRQPPKAIHLYFRHPKGKPIRSVTVNGKGYKGFEGEVVRLKAGGRVKVVARF